MRRRRRLGELNLLAPSHRTIAELHTEWWAIAERSLARKTCEVYAGAWKTHLEPRLGKMRLSEVTPVVLENFVSERLRSGAGPASVQKSLTVISQMFERAVAWGWVAKNPAAGVKKPRGRPPRAVRPLTPSQVEAIRSHMQPRDATLVSVLAYAGLRPGEALALRWGDVRDGSILVDKAVSLGEEKSTKTRRNRSVRVLPSLASDLREWRLASGRPGDDQLVFPGEEGLPWDGSALGSWRNHTFKRAVLAAGLPRDLRPYDLRHSRASILIQSGLSVVEVAQQMGHSPAMTLEVYAHIIDGLHGRIDIDETIREARQA